MFVPPFWIMRRSAFAEEANMVMSEVALEMAGKWHPNETCAVEAFGECMYDKIRVPVAVNSKPLQEGNDRVLHWAGQAKKK